MAIRAILNESDATLRKISRPVTAFDDKLAVLLDDMKETMYHANGAGLAAPQVGILRRAVVIDAGEGYVELVNPEIVSSEGEIEDAEGCLSSPGEYGMVKRPQTVQVRAFDREGKEFIFTADEFFARACCHEIDHLNGILYKDLVTRMLEPDEIG